MSQDARRPDCPTVNVNFPGLGIKMTYRAVNSIAQKTLKIESRWYVHAIISDARTAWQPLVNFNLFIYRVKMIRARLKCSAVLENLCKTPSPKIFLIIIQIFGMRLLRCGCCCCCMLSCQPKGARPWRHTSTICCSVNSINAIIN